MLEIISTHSLTRRLTYISRSQSHLHPISTHSLTRRLTVNKISVLQNNKYFNSQPHKEADGQSANSYIKRLIFQLTASQGGWQRINMLFSNKPNISTHSLTRRLTFSSASSKSSVFISTHSLTRRLTRICQLPLIYLLDFNSQPHKEADNQWYYY